MENSMFSRFPIDPMVLIIGFSVLSLVLLVVVVICIIKMNKLYRRYDLFMRGRDAESLEDTLKGILEELEDLHGKDKVSKDAMRTLSKQVKNSFQKFGYVKYNAFKGMGGNLSFAIAMLDSLNSGFVLDVVHSREGCYIYLKEVEEGATEVLLGNEEQEALEQALGYIKRTPFSERVGTEERIGGRNQSGSGEQSIEVPNSERKKSERMKELRRRQMEKERFKEELPMEESAVRRPFSEDQFLEEGYAGDMSAEDLEIQEYDGIESQMETYHVIPEEAIVTDSGRYKGEY